MNVKNPKTAILEELKKDILEDLAPFADFAAAIDKSERTVRRLNLPVAYIGKTPYVIISKAKAMLLAGNQKRGRGRPRKQISHSAA